MIKYITDSSIFSSRMQTITNPCNCIGVMGKGLALEFKIRWPGMFDDYAQLCKNKEIRIGHPYLYKLSTPWILNFPTKRTLAPSRISYIVTGLSYLKNTYRTLGITSLAVPALGCGYGGLEWEKVRPILVKYLEKWDIPVEIYRLKGVIK